MVRVEADPIAVARKIRRKVRARVREDLVEVLSRERTRF